MLQKISRSIDKVLRQIRDELIRLYPLTDRLMETRQEDAWLKAFEGALNGKFYGSVADVLQAVSLGYTQAASGLETDIDISSSAFPFIFDSLNRLTETTGETIHYLHPDGSWKNMKGLLFKKWVMGLHKSGFVELAITDRGGHIARRVSVSLWRQVGNTFESVSPSAPVKKVLSGAPDLPLARTEAAVEPIDIVYTWVNSDDPDWRQLIAPYRKTFKVDHDRFAQVDELRYSIRSVFTFAPWFRKMFIFTNCAPPEWFVPSERVVWVQHSEVIPERYLPLFSSHSIETFLHEIPGLSERYVYFNDDVFLSAPVRPLDFFNGFGQSISRMEASGVIPHLIQRVEAGISEEWQNAAVNCARLFEAKTGILPLRLHRHTPHAYQRSVYDQMVSEFPKQMEITRKARFRKRSDFSMTSFLFHHYALSKGRAAHIDEDGMIVRATNYQRFLKQRIYSRQRFFCINDGGGSANDSGFRDFKRSFLEKQYPFRSGAED